MNNWTPSIVSLLDKIRLSCIQLTNRPIKTFYIIKGRVLTLKSLQLY